MARAMEGELRGMGIPFFCLKGGLVGTSGGSLTGGTMSSSSTTAAKTTTNLTTDEAADLKRKMLELLLDLCRD
jgi:hypothetical protein